MDNKLKTVNFVGGPVNTKFVVPERIHSLTFVEMTIEGVISHTYTESEDDPEVWVYSS